MSGLLYREDMDAVRERLAAQEKEVGRTLLEGQDRLLSAPATWT